MKRRGRLYNLLSQIVIRVIEDDDVSYEDLEELLSDVHFRKPNNHRGCDGLCWIRGDDSLIYTESEINGKLKPAHRVSFETFTNTKIKNYGCHECDTPACINPDHVYDGANWENIRDAKIEKIAKQTQIKNPKVINRRELKILKLKYRQQIIDCARIKGDVSRGITSADKVLGSLKEKLYDFARRRSH